MSNCYSLLAVALRFLCTRAGSGFLGLLCFVGLLAPARCDEGMFPISDLANIGLRNRGIELTAEEIFKPQAKSIVDGICRVNGCTGSFV
jgi:hypothetical protein